MLLFFKSNPEGTLMETWKFQGDGFIYSVPQQRILRQKGSKVALRRGDMGTEEASICLNNGES